MREPMDHARRRALRRGAALICSALACAAFVHSGAARAKAAKSQMQYQTHPHDGKSCASCRFFTASTSDNGSCALVDGEISRDGWCVAFAART